MSVHFTPALQPVPMALSTASLAANLPGIMLGRKFLAGAVLLLPLGEHPFQEPRMVLSCLVDAVDLDQIDPDAYDHAPPC